MTRHLLRLRLQPHNHLPTFAHLNMLPKLFKPIFLVPLPITRDLQLISPSHQNIKAQLESAHIMLSYLLSCRATVLTSKSYHGTMKKKKTTIKSPDTLPVTITQLQKYFPGARSYDSGGRIWSKVHLRYPVPANRVDFENDINSLGKAKELRFYIATVQHANVKTACWLPYLTGYTNCTLLSKKIPQSYQLTMGDHVPIGANNRFLNGQKDTPLKERIRAIHIE